MTIFISIVSSDDSDIASTIADALDKAISPDQLNFGIVDQSQFDRYDQIPCSRDRFHYIWLRSPRPCNTCYARALVQAMMSGEQYVFQIYPSLRFDRGWDEIMINQMQGIPWKSVLTSIPVCRAPSESPGLHHKEGRIEIRPHQSSELVQVARSVVGQSVSSPLMGDRLCSDFLFSRGCLYDHVPYDYRMPASFEESTYALRVAAAGWSIYYLAMVPAYNNETRPHPSQDMSCSMHDSLDPQDHLSDGCFRDPRFSEVMNGGAGIYGLPVSRHLPLQAQTDVNSSFLPSFSFSSDLAEETRQDLQSLASSFWPLLYGHHSPVAKGTHSSFVNKIVFGPNVYILKSSTYDIRVESIVNSYFFKSRISLQGSSFSVANPLLSLSFAGRHYMLYSFYDHLNLGSIKYKHLFEYSCVPRAIGEFNSANSDHQLFLSLPRKVYQLFINAKRLQRRFPDQDPPALASLLGRAEAVYDSLLKAHRQIPLSHYSFSHNDLHRKNIGLLYTSTGRISNKVVLMDFSRACWAPLGNDLFFYIFYLIMARASADSWKTIVDEYCVGLRYTDSAPSIEHDAIIAAAFIGYAQAWLNIHMRPASSFDWFLFNFCVQFCERYVLVGWPSILEELPSLYDSTDSMRPS
jgi:hypothetical protein